MPIRPENRKFYGKQWRELTAELRLARRLPVVTDDGTMYVEVCEWCKAENGLPNPLTGSKVVLTVAHLNRVPGDDRPENLAVLCQRCHNDYDALDRARNRKHNAIVRLENLGQHKLF